MDKVSYDSELEQWRVISIIEALKMKAGELELPPDWRRSGRQDCFFFIFWYVSFKIKKKNHKWTSYFSCTIVGYVGARFSYKTSKYVFNKTNLIVIKCTNVNVLDIIKKYVLQYEEENYFHFFNYTYFFNFCATYTTKLHDLSRDQVQERRGRNQVARNKEQRQKTRSTGQVPQIKIVKRYKTFVLKICISRHFSLILKILRIKKIKKKKL